MYRDKSLLPTQAIRLCALGSLAVQPKSYANLATETRLFTSAIVGPSLDLLGTSIELLRFEGLVEADGDNLVLTEAGRIALRELLTAPLKTPVNDIGKLVVSLKLRFLHLLDREDRAAQAELLIEMAEGEVARLTELQRRHRGEPGPLESWLTLDLAQAQARLAWFQGLRSAMDAAAA
jgi:hypothetical protein